MKVKRGKQSEAEFQFFGAILILICVLLILGLLLKTESLILGLLSETESGISIFQMFISYMGFK